MKKRRNHPERRKEAKNKEIFDLPIWLLILVLVAIVILYYISLGTINWLDTDKKKDRLGWIEKRLDSLYSDAKTKRELQEQLDKRVKSLFFKVRCFLGIGYVFLNLTVLYFIPKNGVIDKLAVLLNYNQAALIIILVVLFIRYETPQDYKSFNKIIHLFVKKVVYKSHTELSKEIEVLQNEIDKLTTEKEEIKAQLVSHVEGILPVDAENKDNLN